MAAILAQMPNGPEIRLMTLADVEPVSAALSRAFYDDPLQIPDDSTRLALLEAIFVALSRHLSVPAGMTWTDATCSAAAFWVPPGPLPTLTAAAKFALDDLDRRLSPAVVERLKISDRVLRAARPPGEYFYLQGVGTEPARQGQGFACRVLAPVLERCDRERKAAYLESTKEQNVTFYEHRGFRVTGIIEVPDGGPCLWSMWRDPA
jgi:GNAT superfamily N-acetyltransferase